PMRLGASTSESRSVFSFAELPSVLLDAVAEHVVLVVDAQQQRAALRCVLLDTGHLVAVIVEYDAPKRRTTATDELSHTTTTRNASPSNKTSPQKSGMTWSLFFRVSISSTLGSVPSGTDRTWPSAKENCTIWVCRLPNFHPVSLRL